MIYELMFEILLGYGFGFIISYINFGGDIFLEIRVEGLLRFLRWNVVYF